MIEAASLIPYTIHEIIDRIDDTLLDKFLERKEAFDYFLKYPELKFKAAIRNDRVFNYLNKKDKKKVKLIRKHL